MKKLQELILKLYSGNEIIYLFYSLLGIGSWIYYRDRIISLASKTYPEYQGKYFSFLYSSVHYDITGFAIFAAIMFVMFLFSPLGRFKVSVLGGLLVIGQFTFIRLCIDFFKVYETSFQVSFIGGEQFSGISDMIKSALAELSFETFVYVPVLLVIILAVIISLELISFHVFDRGSFSRVRLAALAAAISIYVISAVLVATVPEQTNASIAGKFNADISRATLLREMSLNPLYSIFFEKRETVKMKTAAPAEKVNGIFGSNSIEKNKKDPVIKEIKKGKRYNIIIYLFESTAMKYYDMQVNGTPLVPQMHRLAEHSLFLNMHYTNYPLSANSMFAIMNSKYPMFGKDMVLEKYPAIPIQSLPEVLHDNGYRTCYVHTGDLGYAGQRKYLNHRKIDRFILYKDLINQPGFRYDVGWGADERAMIEPAVNYIKESSQPFFMVISPMNPHHPYAMPPNSIDISDAAKYTGREKVWRDYQDSLYYADKAMGEMIDRLEKEGLMENTLFFMLVDHGEAFYQHRMNYNHPLFVYEENVHIPALIYNKTLFSKKTVINKITRHIDITPTILDILGIPDPEKREGVSLLTENPPMLSFIHTSWKDEFSAVRDYRWKYILKVKDMQEELYDLDADPDEKNNLALTNLDIAARYREYVLKGIAYQKMFYLQYVAPPKAAHK